MKWWALIVSCSILLFAAPRPVAAGEASLCRPSFRQVSAGKPIEADIGSWRVVFKVALIGCREHLEQLSDEEVERLEDELREPEGWSNLRLINPQAAAELRRQVPARLNDVVGRSIVTDVLYHDIHVIDHNRQ